MFSIMAIMRLTDSAVSWAAGGDALEVGAEGESETGAILAVAARVGGGG